jgi:hypothetical protein
MQRSKVHRPPLIAETVGWQAARTEMADLDIRKTTDSIADLLTMFVAILSSLACHALLMKSEELVAQFDIRVMLEGVNEQNEILFE